MKKTGMMKRLLVLALVLTAVLTASSAFAADTIPAGGFGKTTIDKVFFRRTADTKGDYWALLPQGWELQVLGTKTADKILWYKVQGGTPSAPGRTYTGYIHSGYFTASDGSAAASQAASAATTAASTTSSSVRGYVRTVKSGVNIRKTPNGAVLTAKDEYKIPYNTVLAYTDGPLSNGGYNWVKVSYKGNTGYIRSDCWTQTNSSGSTISKGAAATPVAIVPEGTEPLGIINLTTGGVNFRMTPNGTIMGRLNKNTKMNYYGTQIVNAKELWYLVYSNEFGSYGYVLGSLAKVISGETLPVVTPTPTPSSGGSSSTVAASGTLVTTANKLNLRKTPSLQATVLTQIPKSGVKLSFSESKVVGGIAWYKVKYANRTGWLHGNFVRVTSSASSGSSSTSANTGTTAATSPVPDPSLFSEIAFTTADKVFIRKEASMSGKQLTTVYKSGTKMTYNGKYVTDTTSKPGTTYTWYNVTSGSVTGWMRGEFIRILTQEEKKVYLLTGNANAPLEAAYTTLSKGSEGDAVKRLQQALANLGFLAASEVTGTYTTATEKAVIAFQASRGLTQDGIAGEKTQHALYNTVPIGTYDSSTVTATLYPVEMVDWYSGDIQTVWANNSIAVITDVYTGISFRAYRIYGGNHADAVPYSAEDTVAYCQMFGTSNAQEIADREDSLQTWRRRPLWVTVGGRTFAASLYGTPHNFSDSIVKNANATLKNNFVGQFCVHFVNSKTHDSSTSAAHVDYDNAKNGNFGHQSAIKYAYNHSMSGTK